jgi:alkyl hydroperoxide reductase subunit F
MAVVIYTMEGCPFCERAKSFLMDMGISYEERVISLGTEEWHQMRAVTGSGSLPGILINNAPLGGYADLINAEASGELYERLGMTGKKSTTPLYDVIIIGAGPAGLSAAIYTARKLMKTLVISLNIGGQVAYYYDLENYLGFSQVNAPDLVSKFADHVKQYGVETDIGDEVTAVDFLGPFKRVSMGGGKNYLGKTVVIATGSQHRPLNVPGEHELVGRGVSYCSTCDAPLYRGYDVAVVGGGNSGLQAVIDLIHIANKITLISLTPLTGDLILQDKVKQSPKVEIITEYAPTRILGTSGVEEIEIMSAKTSELKRIKAGGVFVEIGLMPNSSLFVDFLTTNPKGEILVDTECRTGVAGVFACGDVTSVPFKQVVVAAGEGAKAALSAYQFLINQR